MMRWKWFLLVFSFLCGMSACTALQDATHNKAGGYIPACGDLPGLVGDDC